MKKKKAKKRKGAQKMFSKLFSPDFSVRALVKYYGGVVMNIKTRASKLKENTKGFKSFGHYRGVSTGFE